MEPVRIKALAPETIERIGARLSLKGCTQESLLRPCQASMPMGFKLFVFVAHTFASTCLRQAYQLLKSSKWAPNGIGSLTVLASDEVPITLSDKNPVLLHTIDYVVDIAVRWPEEAMKAWYRKTRNMFAASNLPVAEKMSFPVDQIETASIGFIRCTWDLQKMAILPAHKKLSKMTRQARDMLAKATDTKIDWLRITGQLIWFATLDRPLLSCAKKMFKEGESQEQESIMQISPETKKELRTLTGLLPLARVDLALMISQWMIAFDTSSSAGPAFFGNVTLYAAERIWFECQREKAAKSGPLHETSGNIKTVVNYVRWRRAIVYCWQKEEYINGLEATAAVLSLKFAVRAGVRHSRLIMLTDSLVTLGALRKGRSSGPGMLFGCKRFAKYRWRTN